MLRLQMEDAAWSVDVESAFVVLIVTIQLLGFHWSLWVVVEAHAFDVLHVDHLLRFKHVFWLVAVVHVELAVVKAEVSTLPIGHSHVC